MKEQTAHVGGGRKLADPFDVTLPAQQRRGLDRAVLTAVIDGVSSQCQRRSFNCSTDSNALGSSELRNCSRTERKKRSILPRPSG